jgi:nicotinic acid mononucleotide adenylyltransferase
MSSPEHWPVDKIAGNLASAPRGRRCVLLSTGALNPVHLGHVAMFDRARDALESEYGFAVVGGFLSPSHDTYLSGKYGDPTKFIPAAKRLEMCAAATQDHPVLTVASWESSVSGYWPDFPEVTAVLERVLQERFPDEGIGVIYLCGQDHFRHAATARLPGVAVVSRAGHSETSDAARNIYAVRAVADDPFSHISSTRIREALANDDQATLQSYLHPDVLALLR